MAALKCPQCGLFNPDSQVACDCGHPLRDELNRGRRRIALTKDDCAVGLTTVAISMTGCMILVIINGGFFNRPQMMIVGWVACAVFAIGAAALAWTEPQQPSLVVVNVTFAAAILLTLLTARVAIL